MGIRKICFVLFAAVLVFPAVVYASSPSISEPPCIPTTYDEDAVANHGSVCDSQDDCIKSFCFQCPNDTETVIYSSTRPSNQSYCGDVGIVHCSGEIDGDGYYVEVRPSGWNQYRYCWYLYPGIDEDDCYADLYAIKELEKHGLEIWKQVVLNNISEDYFDEHFEIIKIERERMYSDDSELYMEIYFTFNFDWVSYNSSEIIETKKLSGENWEWLSDSEMISNFNEQRSSWRYSLTGSEMESILTENETSSRMQECGVDMYRPSISIDYSTGNLEARESYSIFCSVSENGNSSYYRAEVDLVTGEVSCSFSTSVCGQGTGFPINWGDLVGSDEMFNTTVTVLLLVIVIVVVITLVKVKIF